ncbi:Fe2OG dioxygenase domain-containing protein, partial [Durusdinium trenchii]
RLGICRGAGEIAAALSIGALQRPPAGSCMRLKHICCAKDDWRLMHEVEREIQAASYKKEGDALGFHRSKKHKVAYGESLSEVSLVKHALAVFDLTLVDCWANLYSGEDDMKSMHHDNYQDRHPRATATIGISLGQGRHFAFQNPVNHEEHQVVTENGDIFAFDEPFNNLFKHAVPPETPGTAPGKRIAVIIWANEQDMVPRMVREKNPGMRDIVPLKVDWESWGKCVPGSLSRHDRAGMAGHIFNLKILRSTTVKVKPRNC